MSAKLRRRRTAGQPFIRGLRRPQDRWAGALAWIAVTAAFLSKGLISIVFPGAWTLMLIFFFPNLRKGVRPLLLNAGLPIFLFIIGGWFVCCALAWRHGWQCGSTLRLHPE